MCYLHLSPLPQLPFSQVDTWQASDHLISTQVIFLDAPDSLLTVFTACFPLWSHFVLVPLFITPGLSSQPQNSLCFLNSLLF